MIQNLILFGFEVGNGRRKYDAASVKNQIYNPQKFHENRSTDVRVMVPGHINLTKMTKNSKN